MAVSPVRPYALTGSDERGYSAAGAVNTYHGYSLVNTSLAQREYIIVYEGKNDVEGVILDVIPLNPGEGRSDWYDRGIRFSNQVLVRYTVGGIVSGSIRIG